MCSFLYTNQNVDDINEVNFLNQKRGPDHTEVLTEKGSTYVHNLLSITGNFTPQPFKQEGLIMMYNGEIYNYLELGNYDSDGFCILDLYKKNYLDSFVDLDGEFAILLVDENRKEIILVSDTFGTKPLYYSIENNKIGVSSYPEPLIKLEFQKTTRIEPNTILVFDLESLEIKNTKTLYKFNLEQNVDSFEPWVSCFFESLSKRTKTSLDVLVPLSSGYDSGSICAVLNEINRDYVSFSIKGQENQLILNQRLARNTNKTKEVVKNIGGPKVQEIKNKFRNNVQPFFYGPNPQTKTHEGFDDPGAVGLFYIIEESKNKYGTKIILSGQGADEIMSNIQTYGFQTKNPNKFDYDLSSIFPWGNFYLGSQWSYLMKEECIGGSLGIETRYPFLDRKLVQAYLNLKPELKNQSYKSPLTYLLNKLNYPFKQEKIGFQI